MKVRDFVMKLSIGLLLTATMILSTGCDPAGKIVVSPDPCVRFTRMVMTNEQVDDATRSPEAKRIWRPFFNQTNTHNDVFDATCLGPKV